LQVEEPLQLRCAVRGHAMAAARTIVRCSIVGTSRSGAGRGRLRAWIRLALTDFWCSVA